MAQKFHIVRVLALGVVDIVGTGSVAADSQIGLLV
jgi:hypothetical protein